MEICWGNKIKRFFHLHKTTSNVDYETAKKLCTNFFYWWHNQPGNNTEEGFDKWWNEQNKPKSK